MLESSFLSDYIGVGEIEPTLEGELAQDGQYRAAIENYGSSLDRLARAYEADPEKRRDLSQDIHFQLWRSFARYDSRCSLRTWVYRVAHHVAVSHVMRERQTFSKLVSLEELELTQPRDEVQATTSRKITLEQLSALIQQLKPLDRQVIISYLEDLDATSIAEITGLSAASVSMRVYRIKNLLARQFHKGRNMRSDFPNNEDPKIVWQNQPPGPSFPGLQTIREKARELRAKTKRQLLGSTAAVVGAIALALAGWTRTREPGLHIAFSLGIAWALVGQYLSYKGMGSPQVPGDAAHRSGQEFYRCELLRRSNLLRRFFLWSFGPLVLCLGTLILEGIFLFRLLGRPLSAVVPTFTLFVIWIVAVLTLQIRDKRNLTRQIEELDQMKRERQ